MNCGILAAATWFPEGRMTASEISVLSGVPLEVLEKKIGFQSKPVAGDIKPSQMALEAAKSALKKGNTNAKDVDLIILAYATPQDHLVWYGSHKLQASLGAANARAFDVSCGCASVLVALNLARQQMEAENLKRALVVSAEKLSHLIDHSDPTLISLFHGSDGAGAVLLSLDAPANKIGGYTQISDGRMSDAICVPFQKTKSANLRFQISDPESLDQMLREFYIAHYVEVIKNSLSKSGKLLSDIDFLVTNQVKTSTTMAILDGLNLSKDKCVRTISSHGHVGSVDTILGLEKALELAKPGSTIALAASAAGFSWIGTNVQV